MKYGKLAVFTQPGEPINIIEEEVLPPECDEILVRVLIAGICGSDVHRLKGDVPGKSMGVSFGHEAVGTIERLGEEINADSLGVPLNQGDTVYWMPLTPCGDCVDCGLSNPLRCKNVNWPPPIGKPNGACFRQYATLSSKCVYIRVPPDVAPEDVITFGCGMPTALRGIKQLGEFPANIDVVVQGSGPVGLACTLILSLAGARSIIVIGDPAHRLEAATLLGATHVISLTNTTPETRSELVNDLTEGRGADIVVEAAGTAVAFPEGLDLLGMDGKYLILGLYSGSAKVLINPVRINNYNLRIIGSLGLDIDSYKKTVDIASDHGRRLQFSNLITHRFTLHQLEEALNLVGRGIPIKAVVVPN
ncbi:unnamed protein product [Clonostachys rosea]|uniref:Enoyl reductase (ER) domain-containing protein n=1 Tax=Bionectria ochroleuca TaxID=29856 RepID=A0ABY6UHL5_BIOOC|nr:unnamed protein product [Clonostachys rosea]